MKRFVSNIFKTTSISLVAVSSPAIFGLTSCGSETPIQFANFESYMADDLIKDLQKNYDIQFPYYTVAEMIPAKFEKFYDMAVPCGYELMALLRRGWLEEIDWAKFGVQNMKGSTITDADEAETLFIDKDDDYTGIEEMNKQFTNYINSLPEGDSLKQYLWSKKTTKYSEEPRFQILRFGVPYFAQSFMFAYTGDEIPFYTSGTQTVTSTPTWADIFYTVSPANPNRDARFSKKKIGMVDDARSFHDVSRIVEYTETGKTDWDNFGPADDGSINRMQETMRHVTDKFNNGTSSFVLNSDSAIVSRGLADRKGDQTAVMSWSGDTIFAAQGAEEFEAFTYKDFHIVKPSDASLDEIEYVVMNKKNHSNTKRIDNMYKIVRQICLDGCEQTPEKIIEKQGDNYTYWSMVNWDTIMYTPMLKNIHQAIVNPASEYWTEQEYDEKTVALFIDILSGSIPSTCKHLYGKTMTNLQNSNNHWAWLEQRGRL